VQVVALGKLSTPAEGQPPKPRDRLLNQRLVWSINKRTKSQLETGGQKRLMAVREVKGVSGKTERQDGQTDAGSRRRSVVPDRIAAGKTGKGGNHELGV